jgi:amino acid transporter
MAVYLAGLEIEVVNIMNILLITTSVIAIANLFTKASGRETKSKWDKDKLFFYLHLFLLIAIVFVLIYLSIITPSREEYVELYWKTTEVKNIQNYSDIECEIENCSLSGIYKVGDLTLNNEYYKIMITDLDESGEYDAFCIDLDRDDKYCENVEGPYRYYETFFIDSSAFSSLYFDENQIIFINYPDYVYIENFTVSFVVKSLYSTNLNFNIRVLVNDTLQHDELLELYPGEEILKKVNISLPTENRYKVKVVVSSEVYDEGAYIDFWVDRKI